MINAAADPPGPKLLAGDLSVPEFVSILCGWTQYVALPITAGGTFDRTLTVRLAQMLISINVKLLECKHFYIVCNFLVSSSITPSSAPFNIYHSAS